MEDSEEAKHYIIFCLFCSFAIKRFQGALLSVYMCRERQRETEREREIIDRERQG